MKRQRTNILIAISISTIGIPVTTAAFVSPSSLRIHHKTPIHHVCCTKLDAKSKSTTKKKKTANISGLKGFGSPSSTTVSSSSSGGIIDRSKSALLFYDYLTANGGGSNLKRVGLASIPLPGKDITIRGVMALQDVRKGDPIIEIPYEMALDLGRENADPTLPATTFLQMYCSWMNGDGMTEGFIAGGTGSRKNIGDYFAMLPPFQCADCMGSTDFFSDEALEMMQSPLIKEETLQRRELVHARYERDIETMARMSSNLYRWKNANEKESGISTVLHLQWATWLITSRVLTVQSQSTPHRLMIPLIDMCNHDRDSPHILSGRAEPGGLLKVIAGCDVKAGDAIDISYGGGIEGNDRFIQDYGFLDSGGSKERESGAAVVEGYMAVARKLLNLGKISSKSMMAKLSVADQERELKALRATSLADDEELLASGKIDASDERMALEYRIGLKRAIQELTKD